MKPRRVALTLLPLSLLLTGCMGPQVPCPGLSQNPDGSHTISAPTGKAAEDPSLLEGCEYEYDQDGNLGTERDTDG